MTVKALLQGFVGRILPQALPDLRNSPSGVRLKRFGEINISEFDRSLYGYAEEGSYIYSCTPTPGTGFTWASSGNGVQSFLDTAPQGYIFNREPSGGKSLYLSYIKLIVTTAVTAATGGKFALLMDADPRALTTDSMTTLAISSPNGNLSSPLVIPTIKMQNSATPTVASAITTSTRCAQGWLCGTIPLIGDEYILSFGRGDIAGHPGLTAVETVCRKLVSNHPPVIVPPQCSLAFHAWFPALTTASIVPEIEVAMWAR